MERAPEDADAFQGILRSDDVNLLFAGELSGLGQPALDRQLMAGAKQGFQVFLRNMYVTGRCFHKNLFIHDQNLLSEVVEIL